MVSALEIVLTGLDLRNNYDTLASKGNVDVINGGKKTGYDTKVRYNVSVDSWR